MSTCFFSIIVPVYNVENYLERCILNVLNQTYVSYELILVDDGATDNSGAICDRYATQLNVHVIHKLNGGLSSARNAGLDIAKGEYILFIDSDDYWDAPDALELIYKQIDKCSNDVVIFSCKKLFIASNKIVDDRADFGYLDECKSKKQILDSLYMFGQFPGSAWIMCVKRKLIESYHLRFPVGVTAEDIIWINNVLAYCESIGAISKAFYVYVNGRPGQITSKSTLHGCRGMLMALDDWSRNKYYDTYPAISMQMAHIYQVLLMHYSQLDKCSRESIRSEVYAASKILNSGTSIEKYLIRGLVMLFSPYFIGKLIRFCYKLKCKYDYDFKRNH